MAAKTYRAFQVSTPGKLELVEQDLIEPGLGSLRIRVEASGICHSDTLTVEGQFPGLTFPRVPGHEIIGVVDAVGTGTARWQPGQRVGVGWNGGYCAHCDHCRRDEFFACENAPITGVTSDGGYAEY